MDVYPSNKGATGPRLGTQLVLGYPQHFIFRHRIFFFRIFVGVRNPSHVILIRVGRSSTPPLPPLLRKKNIEIWGRSLGSFLAKNHPNRSYPRVLLACSRIAEGASRWGSRGGGSPPKEDQLGAQVHCRT